MISRYLWVTSSIGSPTTKASFTYSAGAPGDVGDEHGPHPAGEGQLHHQVLPDSVGEGDGLGDRSPARARRPAAASADAREVSPTRARERRSSSGHIAAIMCSSAVVSATLISMKVSSRSTPSGSSSGCVLQIRELHDQRRRRNPEHGRIVGAQRRAEPLDQRVIRRRLSGGGRVPRGVRVRGMSRWRGVKRPARGAGCGRGEDVGSMRRFHQEKSADGARKVKRTAPGDEQDGARFGDSRGLLPPPDLPLSHRPPTRQPQDRDQQDASAVVRGDR